MTTILTHCHACNRRLSIGETIEWFCDDCNAPIFPKQMEELREVHRRNDMRGLQRLRDRARGAA